MPSRTDSSGPTGGTEGHGGHGDHAGHVHGLGGLGHRSGERKGLLRALVLTSTILVVEAVGGWISGSLALLSDAGHMLTDVMALLLSYLALRLAERPRNIRKTFGYYRYEILSALANGVALTVIAGIIGWEAWERLGEKPEVETGTMMAVASIGLLANLGGLWFLSHSRESLNVRGAFLHILSDTLASVAVLAGGAVMHFTGAFIIDPILSLLIAVIIVIGAARLVREAVDILLEAVPPHIDYQEVAGVLTAVEGIDDLHDLHIWTITSGMYALSVHIVVHSSRLQDSDQILNRVKHELLERYEIDHTTIQIETECYEHVGPIC